MSNGDNIDVFDVAKFIMAIMVVSIHTLGKYAIYPIFRIAVPLFFMISSFLFFSNSKKNNSTKYLKKFCIRNIKLYFFYFIILMPIFLPLEGYFQGTILLNSVKLCVRFIFGSTFPSSWYLMALIIGIIIIFCFQKMDIRFILLITFLVYALCCFNSNYRNLFDENSLIVLFNKIFPGTIYNSFLVSLFWIALGYLFACKRRKYNQNKCIVGLIISLFLLLGEYFIVIGNRWVVDNDCYFMLIPTCYFIFEILVNLKWKSKRYNVKILRKYSTVIYCVHGSLVLIINHFFIKNIICTNYLLKFIIVLFMSLIIAYIIDVLEKRKLFKYLKYAY